MKTRTLLLTTLVTFAISNFAFSQASHVTCSLKNCSSSSANTLEFDLYIVNDGSSSLKLNSTSYGVNINEEILEFPSDVLTWTWTGQSDLPASITGTFSFSYSTSLKQLKVTSSSGAVNSGNAPTLALNVPVKVGHFKVTNTSHNWAHASTTNLSLNTTVSAGNTNTGAVGYPGSGSVSESLNTSVTRAVGVICSTVLNNGKGSSVSSTFTPPAGLFGFTHSVGETKNGQQINGEAIYEVYPNPSAGHFVIHLNINTSSEQKARLEVLNALGQSIIQEMLPVENGDLFKEMTFSDDIAAGIYTIRLTVDDQTFQSKLVYQY